MKYSLIILVVLSITIAAFLSSCRRDFDNPFDPLSGLKPEAWAPGNLSIEPDSANNITNRLLRWEYEGDERIEGFRILRKKEGENWVERTSVSKDTREWLDSGLTPDLTIYEYRVFAYAGSNNSKADTIATIAKFPKVESFTVDKNDPDDDVMYKLGWNYSFTGHSGFIIDRKTNNETDWVSGKTVADTATTFIDDNIFRSKEIINVEYSIYAYFVTANDTLKSDTVFVNTNAVLTTPTDLQVKRTPDSSIKKAIISWYKATTGEDGFIIEQRFENGEWAVLSHINKETYNYIHETDRLESTAYRVCAYVDDYKSSFSNSDSFDFEIPAPASISVEKQNHVEYKISWNYNYTDHKGFRLSRNLNNSEWISINDNISPSSDAYIDTNIFMNRDNNYSLQYKIEAFYDDYSSPAILSGVVQAYLEAPVNLQVSAPMVEGQGNNVIEISWEYNHTGHSGFRIFRKRNQEAWEIIDDISNQNTNYVDTDVLGIYQYRVHALANSFISEGGTSDTITGGIGRFIPSLGGFVFYLDDSGGFVCPLRDQQYPDSINIKWGCQGTLIGNTDSIIGSGAQNTELILLKCNYDTIAAGICHHLTVATWGYSFDDWFLPSIHELEKMHINLNMNGIGNFRNNNSGGTMRYWSSTEYYNHSNGAFDAGKAFFYVFIIPHSNANPRNRAKDDGCNVRAARRFSYSDYYNKP